MFSVRQGGRDAVLAVFCSIALLAVFLVVEPTAEDETRKRMEMCEQDNGVNEFRYRPTVFAFR